MNHEMSRRSGGRQRKRMTARNRVNVDIRAEQVERLLTLARAQGVTAGEVIYEALARHLAHYEVPIMPEGDRAAASRARDESHLYVNDEDAFSGPADCVEVIDLGGHIRKWNRGTELLLGYRSEEMLVQAIQMIPPKAQGVFADLFARVVRGESIAEIETQFIHHDGHLVDVMLSLFPWKDDGEIIGVMAIFRDVSALKRRERDAAYIASVARAGNSSVNSASLLADVARLTAEWTTAARILTLDHGVVRVITCEVTPSDDDAETQTCLSEQQVTDPESLVEWEVLTANTPIVREIRDGDAIRPSSRSDCYVAIASVPIWAEGEVVGALSALRCHEALFFDAQTVATLSLIGEQVGLAITKVRLLETVREQLKALEAAIRYKDDFLAALSHELRTPLTAILGFAVMIVENDTMGFLRRREMAGDIVASAVLMRSLVNDLLNLVQLREGQLVIQYEAVDLALLMRLCVRLLTPLIAVKSQKVVTQIPANLPPVRAERTRLEQVILNLLINANKYTLPNGTVTVNAAVDGSAIVISVHDTGIGIASEDMERVFALFERGETEYSRAQGGAGIGLAVSREIIEAMDGTLVMESKLGEGSIFTVRLPMMQ